jgi:hypothetical protein
MTAGIITAIVSAVTSLVVALGTQYFSARATRQLEQAKERDRINFAYLNPLRLYLEEVYARLARIEDRLQKGEGRCQDLLPIKRPEDLSDLPEQWFVYEGYYLMSSCYLTACLFFYLNQVRRDVAFLQLSKEGDTTLINLMFQVSLALGKTGGTFYILQGTIAEDMVGEEGKNPVSYRTFCHKLRDPDTLIWFQQLIKFYIAMGQGKQGDRLKATMVAIQHLLRFLESRLGGGTSIQDRLITPSKNI